MEVRVHQRNAKRKKIQGKKNSAMYSLSQKQNLKIEYSMRLQRQMSSSQITDNQIQILRILIKKFLKQAIPSICLKPQILLIRNKICLICLNQAMNNQGKTNSLCKSSISWLILTSLLINFQYLNTRMIFMLLKISLQTYFQMTSLAVAITSLQIIISRIISR